MHSHRHRPSKPPIMQRLFWLVWLVLIACVGVEAGCTRKNAEDLEANREKSEREWHEAAKVLAKRHNAITDWAADLPLRGLQRAAFSIDVSRRSEERRVG